MISLIVRTKSVVDTKLESEWNFMPRRDPHPFTMEVIKRFLEDMKEENCQ